MIPGGGVRVEHCIIELCIKEIIIDDRFADPGLSGIIDDPKGNEHPFEKSEIAILSAQTRRRSSHRKAAECFYDPVRLLVHEHVQGVSRAVCTVKNANCAASKGFPSQVLHGKRVIEKCKWHAQLIILVYHGKIAGPAHFLQLPVDAAEGPFPAQYARFPGLGILDVHEQFSVPAHGAPVDPVISRGQSCYAALCRDRTDLR